MRAADLIGQLGDPHYLRKANALYHEFEEVGMNRQLGYKSPADLTDNIHSSTGTAFRTYADRDPLSQCHIKRSTMDRQLIPIFSVPNATLVCAVLSTNRSLWQA